MRCDEMSFDSIVDSTAVLVVTGADWDFVDSWAVHNQVEVVVDSWVVHKQVEVVDNRPQLVAVDRQRLWSLLDPTSLHIHNDDDV